MTNEEIEFTGKGHGLCSHLRNNVGMNIITTITLTSKSFYGIISIKSELINTVIKEITHCLHYQPCFLSIHY